MLPSLGSLHNTRLAFDASHESTTVQDLLVLEIKIYKYM